MPTGGEFDESRIRAFLLGSLPEQEAAGIEQRLAGDADFRELVKAIEEELFDDHARGRLPAADAAQFSAKYLNTREGRERLQFARAFAGQTITWRKWAMRWYVPAAAAGLLLCFISFQAGRMFLHPTTAIDLRPGSVRQSPSNNVLELHRGISVVEFRLYPDQTVGDRASLLTLNEQEVMSGQTLALHDGGRRFLVAAEILPSGTYIIRLDHEDASVATFVVRIQKK